VSNCCIVEIEITEQLTIEVESDLIEISSPGPQGPAGAGGSAKLTFVQSSPSATWTINHNFGYSPVSVRVLSTGGAEVEADVRDINVNQTIIYFSIPFAGRAELI